MQQVASTTSNGDESKQQVAEWTKFQSLVSSGFGSSVTSPSSKIASNFNSSSNVLENNHSKQSEPSPMSSLESRPITKMRNEELSDRSGISVKHIFPERKDLTKSEVAIVSVGSVSSQEQIPPRPAIKNTSNDFKWSSYSSSSSSSSLDGSFGELPTLLLPSLNASNSSVSSFAVPSNPIAHQTTTTLSSDPSLHSQFYIDLQQTSSQNSISQSTHRGLEGFDQYVSNSVLASTDMNSNTSRNNNTSNNDFGEFYSSASSSLDNLTKFDSQWFSTASSTISATLLSSTSIPMKTPSNLGVPSGFQIPLSSFPYIQQQQQQQQPWKQETFSSFSNSSTKRPSFSTFLSTNEKSATENLLDL